MKQYITLMLVLTGSYTGAALAKTCDIQNKEKVIAHSFMFTHPASFNHVARQAIWHSFINNKCGSSAFQAISIVQQSFPDKKTAEYFLFCGKSELLVLGDTAPGSDQRDVRAEWLGIDNSDFTGVLQIDPKQSQLGIIVEYHIDLKHMDTIKAFKDYWVSLTIPTFLVKNDMNLKQVGVSNRALVPPRDIIEAFAQRAWEFGKINGERSEIGISCFDIRIGKTYHSKNSDEVVYYTGVSIPVGPHQNAEYVFDSFRGNNGHFGIFAGINFQLVMNRNSYYHQICWFLDFDTLFLIRNSQNRTYDLRNKQWSRYLLLNRKDGPPDQNIPAVNILTVFSRVRPYDLIDFSTGFRIIGPNVEAELGYSVWGHSSERVSINCNFPEIYGIAGKGPLLQNNPCVNPESAASASKSTIACQAQNDEEFIVICQSDLDLKSAAANHTTNHKFYVSVGYTYWGTCIDGFFGAGGFYEFPQKNAALTIGGVWFKLGASF
jgi:hypothetical protein